MARSQPGAIGGQPGRARLLGAPVPERRPSHRGEAPPRTPGSNPIRFASKRGSAHDRRGLLVERRRAVNEGRRVAGDRLRLRREGRLERAAGQPGHPALPSRTSKAVRAALVAPLDDPRAAAPPSTAATKLARMTMGRRRRLGAPVTALPSGPCSPSRAASISRTGSLATATTGGLPFVDSDSGASEASTAVTAPSPSPSPARASRSAPG